MRNVVTVILAAGESKRIKSNKSKIFHEVAGLSMIEYVYSVAKKISSKNIIIVCNKKNIIQISKKFPQAKVIIQKKQNGTAGAVLVAKKIIKKNQDVLILYGDVPLIKDISIKRLIKTYNNSKTAGSLLVFETQNPRGYGRVEVIGNVVKKITEEVNANKLLKLINLCNSGIMICKKKFLFDNLIKISNKNIKKEKFITDIFEIAYKRKKPFHFTICDENELQGANTREDLINIDITMQKNIKKKLIQNGVTILQPETVRVSYDTKISKDCIIEPNVIIKKGVILNNNVTIKSHSVLENCIIGENSSIGPFARIRPFSKIGKKVKIGNFVEIKNSIIKDNSSISHLSYIGDSIVGKNVNIGAGTITCNYDGKKKNKTIIRDNVFIGSNTSLIAPLIIGSYSTVGAGSVITKNVPSNSLAIERSEQRNFKKIQQK